MENSFSLWKDGPIYENFPECFPLGTDSVLLGDFAKVSGVKKALDLGCGGGILPVLILSRRESINMHGMELSEKAVQRAKYNIERNNFSADNIICADIKDYKKHYSVGEFDLVVTNPPYFSENSGAVSEKVEKYLARCETECSLNDIIEAGSFLTKSGGNFALVQRANRMAEIISLMTKYKLEPKRIRLVSHTINHAPRLVLIEGQKNAKAGLTFEKTLFLHELDGSYTEEYKRIYHLED